MPLSKPLNSGDQVEIITSNNAKPSANWIDYVTTGRALSKIKSSLKEEKKISKKKETPKTKEAKKETVKEYKE